MTVLRNEKMKGRFTRAEIVRRVDLTRDLWKIWLRPEIALQFKAGQYCTIGAEGIERPYSIASSPVESEIELFIELIPYPDGELTPVLHKLSVGDVVTMRPRAKGLFVLKPEFENHVMISTVTGVAPFVSMLREHLGNPTKGHRFFVFEGASYLDEFGYDQELVDISNTQDEITFIPTVSRPNDKANALWTGEAGRVNGIFESHVETYSLNASNTVVYACGHPLMIEDVRRRVEGTGMEFVEERFWKEDEG